MVLYFVTIVAPLKEKQSDFSSKYFKVTELRWNSSYVMMQRLHEEVISVQFETAIRTSDWEKKCLLCYLHYSKDTKIVFELHACV